MNKYESLTKEYKEIYAEITNPVDSKSGDDLSERISLLNVYLARVGKMLAEAEYLLNSATIFILEDTRTKTFAPSIQKKWIDANTKEYSYLARCLERMGSTIVHQIDGTRSQLSFLKQEMMFTK